MCRESHLTKHLARQTALFPVVDIDASSKDAKGGQPLLGLLRLEFVRPESLVFEASGEKREELQRELSKLLVDKERKRLRDLKRKAEEETRAKAGAVAKEKKRKEDEVVSWVGVLEDGGRGKKVTEGKERKGRKMK